MSKMRSVDLGTMDYDGSQLHHAFAYEEARILGPTITHFFGAANVREHLVDLEDALDDDFIKSEKMAHFIIEIPNIGIQEAVVWQRLFIRIIAKHLQDNYGGPEPLPVELEGDDIMVDNQKLSVSIATLSRFSGLIHVGINVHVGDGCPVDAIGLNDFGALNAYSGEINAFSWRHLISSAFVDEYNDIVNATYKVIDVT